MGFKIKPIIPIILLSTAILFTAKAALAVNQDFCGYIASLYKYGIGAIGILAALGIAIAGVIWVTAAGNESKVKEAKSWIGSSLMGLALALTAFLILGTINPALTTCNTYSLSTIGSLGTGYSTDTNDTSQQLVYSPKSQQKGLTKSDGSGVYWCCVIDGELDGTGFVDDSEVSRCASYELAQKDAAQKECVFFYNNYNEERVLEEFKNKKIGNYTGIVYYKRRIYLEKPPSTTNGEKNSASIYSARCENNPTVKSWCEPKADPDFCKTADEGDSCKFSDGITWGYCKNKTCNHCKKWGDECNSDYECPHQLHKLSDKCGNDLVSLSKKASDCTSTGFFGTGKNYCDYEGPANYY